MLTGVLSFMNGHTHIIGASGSGKSTELIRRALSDIEQGHAVLFFDPHGEDIDTILSHFPKSHPAVKDPARYGDLVVFDPSAYPIACNLLRAPGEPATLATAMLDTWRSIAQFGTFSTPDFDETIYNSSAVMIENGGTILGMMQMLVSKQYRNSLTISDPVVCSFWSHFDSLTPKEQREKTKSALSRLRLLLADPRVRNCIGQSDSVFDIKDIIENRKVLLIRLPQGKLGISKVRALGQLLLAQAHATALSIGQPVSIYLDEVHHFTGTTFSEMLSGARKFGVSLTFAHQYLDQLDPDTLKAVQGNTSTTIVFRLGLQDSVLMHRHLFGETPDNNNPKFYELDAFTARTFESGADPHKCYPAEMEGLAGEGSKVLKQNLLRRNRGQFGSRRSAVERNIASFMEHN